MRKTIFIADAHIKENTAKADSFFEYLRTIGELDCDIVFLGDIFELWIAFPGYETPVHRRFLDWCRTQSSRHSIGFLEGNHEFYVSHSHANSFSWVTDQNRMLCGGTLYIEHGDTINIHDFWYTVLRAFLRNGIVRRIVQWAGGGVGAIVSDYIRLSFKNKNIKHKKFLPAAELERIGSAGESCAVTAVVGHFHCSARFRNLYLVPPWEPDGPTAVYDPVCHTFQLINLENFHG